MPYRLKPSDKSVVQVQKSGKWKDLKKHPSTDKAKGHLYMLNKNVKHK